VDGEGHRERAHGANALVTLEERAHEIGGGGTAAERHEHARRLSGVEQWVSILR